MGTRTKLLVGIFGMTFLPGPAVVGDGWRAGARGGAMHFTGKNSWNSL